MRVILQENNQLGRIGDEVEVKPGYARNFLLPKDIAVIANAHNKALFETRRSSLEKKALEQLEAAKQRASEVEGKTITLTAQASEEGKLFGSVGAREVAEALLAHDVTINKNEINLPESTIRNVGEYTVMLKFHSDVTVNINVSIVSSGPTADN